MPEQPRKPEHKALVDAIIDGEVSAKELADRAKELGPTTGIQMMRVVRVIMRRRQEGSISVDKARKMYLEAYKALSLAAFATMAQDIIDTAQASADTVLEAVAEVEDLEAVTPIRKADFMARELEKANGGK